MINLSLSYQQLFWIVTISLIVGALALYFLYSEINEKEFDELDDQIEELQNKVIEITDTKDVLIEEHHKEILFLRENIDVFIQHLSIIYPSVIHHVKNISNDRYVLEVTISSSIWPLRFDITKENIFNYQHLCRADRNFRNDNNFLTIDNHRNLKDLKRLIEFKKGIGF